MRTSQYKDLILAQFDTAHVLSITDIHKALPQADFSTIFRNIEQLYTAGVLKKIVVDVDTVVYERNIPGHAHDHFVCTDCGEVDAIHLILYTWKKYTLIVLNIFKIMVIPDMKKAF